MISNRPNIYLAAPLFTPKEQEWNRSIRDGLVEFSDVYLPQEDGALLVELVKNGMNVADAKECIFRHDILAIERCDILLLVMDGRVIDEGATFELGYAYARGKICIGLKTDVRSLLTIGDNPMIECSLRRVFSDQNEAFSWIRDGRWRPS